MPRSRCGGRALPRVLALLLVLAGSAPLLAADAPSSTEPEFTSRTYRADEGLSSNLVYALAQDRDGYLWVGGSGGLARFDGAQFVAWGAHGEPPLPYGEVRSLLADRDGSLWVGFNEPSVVSRIHGRRVETFRSQEGLPGGIIQPAAQDRTGTVWVISPDGIAAFSGGRWTQRHGRDGLPSAAVDDVREDRFGTLWISTSAGIYRRASGETQFTFVDPGLASDLDEAPDGGLWLAHPTQGIRRLANTPPNSQHPEGTPLALPLTAQSILTDRHGHIWVGSSFRAGLLHVSVGPPGSKPAVRPLSDERGVFDKLALAFLEDSEGNVWVGTSGGLVRFYEPRGHRYSRANGLPDNNVRAIASTHEGDLWLGTASGLAKVTRQGAAELPKIAGLIGRAVTSINTESRDRVLIGFADSGLGVLEGGRFSPIQAPGNTFRDNVMTVRPDGRGGLWVCNLQDRGLYFSSGDSAFRKIEGTFPPGRGGCSATLLDKKGRIWIGFDDGSLMVQERDGVPRFLRGGGGPHGRVCAIHEDRDEAIWIATTAGLGRYKDGQFSSIYARNGLPGDYFTAIVEDQSGDLWISSISGILRLSKAQFQLAVDDPKYHVRYALYDSSDGISDTPVCYGEPHTARDRDGRLWFTSLSGAVVIDPVRMREAAASLTPRIERLVADSVVAGSESPSLRARTARVELHYTAVNLSAGSKVRFQYRLDGFDESWVDAGTRRQAFYTNLAPGRYRFQVRASLNDTAGQPAVYEFDVQPAFYQTGTFYVFIAAIGALLLWAAWQLRLRALHKRYALIMDERTRIGREIHDTVLQSMAGVALEIEGVARQAQTPGAGVREALARISSEIKDHIAEVRYTILELRTSEEGTADLEDALREAGERIVAGTPIHFELAVTGAPPPSTKREVRLELLRIAREALRNAVRHAGATAIRAELRYTDDALHLVISDNGSGFNVEERLAAEGHWGLLGMKERASRIGAQFDIRSRAGAGTAVETIVRYARAT